MRSLEPNYPDWETALKDEFAHISLQEFKRLASSSPGWRFVKNCDFKYSIASNFNKYDEYVGTALYDFDQPLLESLKGSTKVPMIGRAYHNLLKYCPPTIYRTNIQDEVLLDYYADRINYHKYNFNKVGTIPLEIAMTKIPLNTSAGFNFPGKKKGEVLDQAMKNVKQMIHQFSQGKQVEQIPSKLALRGHLSEVAENKTRNIWVAPVEHIILENMLFRGFYSQIFSNAQWIRLIMTGGEVMRRVTSYLSEDADMAYVNTDISGWDTIRARFVLLDIFNKVLKPRMLLDEPWKERAFEYLVDSFIYTHLCLPDGSIFKKLGGVPSGSFLTLLINSLAVDVLMNSCCGASGIKIYHQRVLGDDFCWKQYSDSEDLVLDGVRMVSRIALINFGVVIKEKKVVVTLDVEKRKFIGYTVRNGKLIREDEDWFKGVLFSESPVRSLAVSFTRMYAYLLIGGYNSERFRAFYQWFLSGYYEKLKEMGDELFRTELMKYGNLKVFKHVFHVDVDHFATFSIEDFRKIHSFKIPYFLTLGTRFL